MSGKNIMNEKEGKLTFPTRTIGDLIASIDAEIDDIKSGTITGENARIIAKNRQIQLDAFNVVVAAARLEAKYRPELGRRIGGEDKQIAAPDVHKTDQNGDLRQERNGE